MNDSSLIDEKLNKRSIIRKSTEFSEIINNGVLKQSQYFKVYFLPSEINRVGFAVSRKFGNAVCRNQIKRRMREIYRKNKSCLGNWRMILIPSKDFMMASFHIVEKDFRQLMNGIGDAFDT